jgi:mono/diheme cytochrome c family protein
MPPDDAAAVTPPAPEANDAAREVARPATAPIPTPVESVPAAPTSPKPAAAPAPDPARIATGQRAYARLGCAMCHSIEGRGNPGSPLDGVGARLDRTALYELTTGTGAAAAHLGAGLARRKQRAVGDPDMDALIDYLAQLK